MPFQALARRSRFAALTVLALALLSGRPALADDRELLRAAPGKPYVFIVLDTSGSMNWSPACSQADFNAGKCTFLCPTGDCFTQLNADDPSSKFYQAKAALTQVLQQVDDVQFGFATYNQDALFMRSKHWLYRATTPGPVIPTYGNYPAIGSQEVFGFQWACDTGGGDSEIGCYPDNDASGNARAADLGDSWEFERMQRLPKGGDLMNQSRVFYVRYNNSNSLIYKITYAPVSGTLGNATIQFNVTAARCTNTSCSTTAASPPVSTVTFQLVNQFTSWDNGANRNADSKGYFSQAEATDDQASSSSTSTCAGWDPNTDSFTTTPKDAVNGYSIRYLTDITDLRGSLFHVGDVIPLDWLNAHKQQIIDRMQPTVGNFNSASYFNNQTLLTDTFLRLKNESLRPLVANGSTPLGKSLGSFRQWYKGCATGSCATTGWKATAASSDPDWACRRKFVLVLTDGDDTCGGIDACSATQTLFNEEGIKTYVIAFGVESTTLNPGNKLTCMAVNGGTAAPLFPSNQQELVTALTQIFDQIREQATAFASAAVPSVQADVADKLYLTSFTPLNGSSIWDGHVNAFLKPLPLTPDNKPDLTRGCTAAVTSSCRLWDAGAVLLTQSPTPTEASGGNLRLGLATDQRRVFYPRDKALPGIPGSMRLFQSPAGAVGTDPDWTDLWNGLKIPTTPAATAQTRSQAIIKQTLVQKAALVDQLSGPPLPITFVLGDIFHADPLLIDNPKNFDYFATNLGAPVGATTCVNNPGYRCFNDKHQRRRKMLLINSNDGQLHAFDAGIWNPSAKKFSNGTGKELFSYMPRLTLPVVRNLAEDASEIFAVDGTPRTTDVFIDPIHNGTPTSTEREWRTISLGGFREAGSIDGGGLVSDFISGYYALDITQPDVLTSSNEPLNQNVVPGCLRTDNVAAVGCGPLPFPAVLWEFTDSIGSSRLDEDQNGSPDLGATWSVPTVGRVRVTEGGVLVDKYVAIFGGGYDPLNKTSPKSGNYLYMVDVETGQAIYKQLLEGAATADPAVVDTNLDGLLDTVYIGTTAGFMYKVDLSIAARLESVTLLKTKTIPNLAANTTVTRITNNPATGLPTWIPFKVFTTGGQPIFFAPTALFVSSLHRFALAFGTGNRENLWNFNSQEGRFYLIIDESWTPTTSGLPRTEAQYQHLQVGDNNVVQDFVSNPSVNNGRGWVLELDPDERVITQAFGLSGLLTFSSYKPQIVTSGVTQLCAHSGTSRVFVLQSNNGNAIIQNTGVFTKYFTVPEFLTNPFVESGGTQNSRATNRNADQLDAVQKGILDSLKKLYGKGTKFANYYLKVSSIRSDTGLVQFATIPIAIIATNWKDY